MPRRCSLTADDVVRIMDRAERAIKSTSRPQRVLGEDVERLLYERNRLLAVIAKIREERE